MTDEVVRLRDELERTREQLRQHEHLLAIVAHELRNPIAPVLISLDALLLQVAEGSLDRDGLLARLRASRRYVENLRTQLDRLLDFSRLRSGRLALILEDVDVSQLAATVLDEMGPMLVAARCELRTRFAMPLRGSWDRVRLRQIVWNLLSNAVKYAPGAPIDVATEEHEMSVRLIVTDHGPGIPEQDREAVFKRFERATGQDHHTGFGVGLWLVRRFAEAMGGSVELDSEVGRGSTFIVRLPRSRT